MAKKTDTSKASDCEATADMEIRNGTAQEAAAAREAPAEAKEENVADTGTSKASDSYKQSERQRSDCEATAETGENDAIAASKARRNDEAAAQLLRRMDEIAAENEKIREELSRTRKENAETREKAEKAAELTEGQKQALLERNFHEAMERAKMDKVRITIPADPNGEDDDIFVSVNGYRYLIRRGEEVEVPRFVAEALKNSDRQKLEASRHMKKMQK